MNVTSYKAVNIVVLSILSFMVGFLYINDGTHLKTKKSSDIDLSSDEENKGKYLRFVFIGSSECQFSNREETHKSVVRIKKYINRFSEKFDIGVISTGISVALSIR